MPYKLEWQDEQLLRLNLWGHTTTEELKNVHREAAALAGEVRGLVYLIVDVSGLEEFPKNPQALWQIGDPIFGEPKIIHITFVGVKNPLLKLMASTKMVAGNRLYNFAPDVETAQAAIRKLQEKQISADPV